MRKRQGNNYNNKAKRETIIDSIKKYSQELQHKTELDRKLGKRVSPT